MQSPNPSLVGDVVTQFLIENASKNTGGFQQELQRFARWLGRDRPLAALTPRVVESYAEASGAATVKKLEPVKAFLAYAQQQGITAVNLGVHLKPRRTGARVKASARPPGSLSVLSKGGYEKLQGEVVTLKGQRVTVAQEIQRAMADKDFRENAPLDAAREQQGHLEARIRELEHTLRNAVIADGEGGPNVAPSDRVRQGSQVTVKDLDHGEELCYTLVDPKEVNVVQGKISTESPTGKALLNRALGEEVEVRAPVGVVRYRIERVV